MLDPRRLSLLRDIARSGSIAGAARLAGCTASAASQQLSALEQELDVALLERSARSVRLTEAGRILAEHANRVLAELDAAQEAVRAVSGLHGGRVRVAAFATAASTLVLPALMAFRQRHGEVSLTFREVEPEEAIPAVAAGEIDLAVTHQYERLPRPDLRGLQQLHLHRDRLLLAVPPHLHRAGRTTARLRDYAGAVWLSTVPSEGFQAVTELLCRSEGFEPEIAFRSDHYEMLLDMVAADFGVALVPGLAAVPRAGVTYLEIVEPAGVARDIHLTVRTADSSTATRALTQLFLQRRTVGRPGHAP
ncbi:LysR substrate-binding domain-containing protein [Streptomyces sp. NPDC048277]|uniref:LysR family transcriptional regulator n=1 Tax=Streptomyces sp. NPDC048277 TaxID=3155027 RepID=UPI0033EC953F